MKSNAKWALLVSALIHALMLCAIAASAQPQPQALSPFERQFAIKYRADARVITKVLSHPDCTTNAAHRLTDQLYRLAGRAPNARARERHIRRLTYLMLRARRHCVELPDEEYSWCTMWDIARRRAAHIRQRHLVAQTRMARK